MVNRKMTPLDDTDTTCNTNIEVVSNIGDDNCDNDLLKDDDTDNDFDTKNNKKCDGKKHKNWALTIFNDIELDILKDLSKEKTPKGDNIVKYIVSGEEICPTTGRLHYQTLICFVNARSFASMKKKFPTSHLGYCYKCAKANDNYCSKDKKIVFKFGECPLIGCKVTPDILKGMSDKEIVEYDPRCHKAYIGARDILNNTISVNEWRKDLKVFYIWGKSGIGKSTYAKELVRYLYNEKYIKNDEFDEVKHKGEFFHGMGEAEVCIYDDYRCSHIPASEFINFIDYNRHKHNVKGGTKVNNYKVIIITSITPFYDLYGGISAELEEQRYQWERRMINININVKYSYKYNFMKYTTKHNIKLDYDIDPKNDDDLDPDCM